MLDQNEVQEQSSIANALLKERTAEVYVQETLAGFLQETVEGYVFIYVSGYRSSPVSLTMPTTKKKYIFDKFPPFFDGLLPEGNQLESLLRREKIDRNDFFSQLLVVGGNLIGDVTVKEHRKTR